MAAISVVTVKFVAIGLSQHLAGLYNSAYGYLQIFGILADFGLYAVSVREMSRAKDEPAMLGMIILLRSFIVLLSFAVALVVAFVIPSWQGTPLPLAIVITCFVPVLTLLAGTLRVVFQVRYRMQWVFAAEVTQRVVSVSLIGAAVWLGARSSENIGTLYWFLAAGGIGAAVLLIISLIGSLRLMVPTFAWDGVALRRLFGLALPFGLAFLCTTLYRQSDVTLISLLRPDFTLQNATYGFVQRVMDMTYLVPTFLLNSALPILSERLDKGGETRHLLGKVLLIILILGSTTALTAALWGRPIMGLLTKESYLSTLSHPGADTALQWLAISMVMNGLVVYAFYVLLARHRWRSLVVTLGLAAGLSLGLNLWLIPTLGFVGASITSAVIHTLLAAALMPQAERALKAQIGQREILRWYGFVALLAGYLVIVRPFLTSDLLTALGLAGLCLWLVLAGLLVGFRRTFQA
jgi:O-antigen/teichoic acid export membrane protein